MGGSMSGWEGSSKVVVRGWVVVGCWVGGWVGGCLAWLLRSGVVCVLVVDV